MKKKKNSRESSFRQHYSEESKNKIAELENSLNILHS